MTSRFGIGSGWRAAQAASHDSAGGASCPDLAAWMSLANDELPRRELDELLLHCSRCNECLEVLKQSSPALAQRIAENDASRIEPHSASDSIWLHRLAAELAHSPRRAPRAAAIWRMAGWTAAFASVALAVAGVVVWRSRQNEPERLLALAYAHDRFLDLRIPDAPFAARATESHARGADLHHEGSSLLTARAEIARHLESAPSDSYWLALRARADLLDENYDAAIDTLDRLIASGPVTPSLLTDNASAYFQRGLATGSENDRATALDALRRADEMAPDDPVVLFNEALVMEDRDQLMNAVETWNRYLRFERDPQWLAEGRRHLADLEERLDKVKSHQSRMRQHLDTPEAQRALAADDVALASLDEELSTTLLPDLLNAAFPIPADRSRGSPCAAQCASARRLLSSLAASLEQHHRDPWLTQFLPNPDRPASLTFVTAARQLAGALLADNVGDYAQGVRLSRVGRDGFLRAGNAAGADRAWIEYAYASQRLGKLHQCGRAARSLVNTDPAFAWIQSSSLTQVGICAEGPGALAEANPLYKRAEALAADHHYELLAMRVRNQIAGSALDAGDIESTWRICLQTMRQFYAGDYPSFRAYTILAGLAETEKSTPRTHLELLLQRELLSLLELTPSRNLIPSQRYDLAIAAIRAGAAEEARQQLAVVRAELAQQHDEPSLRTFLADSEIALASLSISRNELPSASQLLDSAQAHMAGMDDESELAAYAAARGQLDLALGHPTDAEPALRHAILHAEASGEHPGASNVPFARENRDLYATLAGIWLAQGKPGAEILALWERYRLRILGQPVPACHNESLNCLAPQVQSRWVSRAQADAQLIGEVLLPDRILDYRSNGTEIVWTQRPVPQDLILAADAALQQVVESPMTSTASVEWAAGHVGDLLVPDLRSMSMHPTTLLVEDDPLLGNLPWPAVEGAAGAIGLTFNLQNLPSLLLPESRSAAPATSKPLIIGASIGAGSSILLPEALDEARAIAAIDPQSSVLLATHATRTAVEQQLSSAALIHFAGHTGQYDGETRLLLAPTGAPDDLPFLDAAELRLHPPRAARLVVLSACSTGRDEAAWNHGMDDMVDTLAGAGVPEVVATRWEIDSASAVVLMQDFYTNLARGISVPQSLTLARRSLAQNPRYRHPYFWAGYYASGTAPDGLIAILHAGVEPAAGIRHARP